MALRKKTTKKKRGSKAPIKKRRRKRGGFFGGERVKGAKRKPYIIPGDYYLLVDEVIAREGWKDDFFIANFKVLWSKVLASEIETEGDRPRGSYLSWNVKMGEVLSLGNIFEFISACTSEEEDELTEEDAEAVCSAEQPLRGIVLKAHAYYIQTKSGQPFTVVDWQLVGSIEDYNRKIKPTLIKKKKTKKKVAKKKTKKKAARKRH